tara:strand:+ start:874 stop:1365 length:492 start_codon:yes stop_codon:yes gene_type:complete
MPQPTADDGNVHPGRDKVDGGRVPEAVRRHIFGAKRRHGLGCSCNISGEFEPHSRSPQRLTVSIDEDSLVWRTRLAFQQLHEQRDRFRPEWTDSFLAPLAIEASAVGCIEPDRIGTQIEGLLDARAAIVQEREQSMVAHTLNGRPIWLGEDRLNLPRLKIAGC